MNITLKRMLCILLVICLMITMPGCTSIGDFAGTMWHLARRVTYLLSYIVIIPVMWVVDQLTWPFVEHTGFNVNDLGNRICQAWTGFILPEALMDNGWWGGWFVIRDEEELETKLREGGHWPQETLGVIDGKVAEGIEPEAPGTEEGETEESVISGQDKLYADPTFPTETFYSEHTGETETGIVIHYDATEGYFAPEDQIIQTSMDFSSWDSFWESASDTLLVPRITEEKPIRPGYHFVGWTDSYNPNDDGLDEDYDRKMPRNELKYFPGEKVSSETGERITGDITLYAVWQKHEYIWVPGSHCHYVKLATDHKYTITEKYNRVTIKCDCGMVLNDPFITEEQFLYCYYDDVSYNSKRGLEEAKKLHKLYLSQNIGPHALRLNTALYNSDDNYEQRFQEMLSELEAKDNVQESIIEQFCNDMDTLCQRIFATKEEGEMAGDYFTGFSKGLKGIWNMITIVKAAGAVNDLADRKSTTVTKAVSMLELAECAVSFFDISDVVEPYTEVLKAGLKLYAQVEAEEKARMNIYAGLLPGNKSKSEYLSYIFGREYPYEYLSELVLGSEKGCSCKTDWRGCDFSVVYPDKDLGEKAEDVRQPLANAPSVAEVYEKMASYNGTEPKAQEKEMVMFYLAERAEHELYFLSGLTLDEYVALIQ